MKHKLICLLFLVSSNLIVSQVSEDLLVNIHSASNSVMNTLSPDTGSMIYNTDLKSVYIYDGTHWKKLNNNLETTYETVAIGRGNQTLTVRDADKIVGFTLISSYNSLSTNTGKMSGTWIINENRDKIRCYIQTLEHPYIKFLVVTVQIKNATNTIEFSNYTSRYWTVTIRTPQNNLSNNGTNYQLGNIVIIRKE